METHRRFYGGCSSERDYSLCCMRRRHCSVGFVWSLPRAWSRYLSVVNFATPTAKEGKTNTQKQTHRHTDTDKHTSTDFRPFRPVATMRCIPGSALLIQVGSKEASGICGGELAPKHRTCLARFFTVQLVSSRPKQYYYYCCTSIYLDINPLSRTPHLWKLGRACDAPVSSVALGV